MPTKFLVFLGGGVGLFLFERRGGGSANFIFLGAGILLIRGRSLQGSRVRSCARSCARTQLSL